MKWLKAPAKLGLGLDIGSHQIKVVLLEKTAKGHSLLHCFMVPLPENTIINNEIRDIELFRSGLLVLRRRLPQRLPITAIAVSGSGVMSKVITMDPSLSDQDIQWQIQAQADTLIPFPLSDVYFDYERLNPAEAQGKSDRVLLSVSRVELIDTRIEVLKEFAVDVEIVDIESHSMVQALLLLDPKHWQAKVTMILCLGHQSLQLAMVNNGATVFTAYDAIGCKQCLEQLNAFLPDPEHSLTSLADVAVDEHNQPIIQSFINELIMQVHRELQMYFSSAVNHTLDKIFICGGGAKLNGIVESLSESFAVPVERLNPLNSEHIITSKMEEMTESDLSQYAIALGLALRGLNHGKN
ncbi:type IV pilus biogenesis protein PilM [Paraferrimonas sp. SM1919]|uniref:type IV pilus biogenesis protein PilM n=1 Tax=Paraferrimonas sp. SM1919 TaxID=2662263 RepID=UPI0013D30DD8|nr:type IV pilus assembly protein PilM [Paraferrimonas sp. SM1919]